MDRDSGMSWEWTRSLRAMAVMWTSSSQITSWGSDSLRQQKVLASHQLHENSQSRQISKHFPLSTLSSVFASYFSAFKVIHQCGEKGALLYCWWEWKVGAVAMENSLEIPQNQSHSWACVQCMLVTKLCPTLCNPDCRPPGSCPWDSPAKNTGMGCHSLL